MTRGKPHRDSGALRILLRRGDPAADGRDPTPGEIAAWKQAMLREADGRHWTIPWPNRIAVAASAVLVTIGLIWIPGELKKPAGDQFLVTESAPAESRRSHPGIGSAGTAGHPAALRHARTIQFRGPNGTRIIWQLDPDFSISGT